MAQPSPKVDEFLARAKRWQAEMAALRAIILSCPLQEDLKWHWPCYALQGSNVVLVHGFKEHFDALKQKTGALERSKTLGNQAYGASTQQDWVKSEGLYREALETCGDCEIQAALHKNLGLVLCRAGNLQEGGSELRKALELNPNDPDVVKALSVLEQNQR